VKVFRYPLTTMCIIFTAVFMAGCGKNLLDELAEWDLVYISDSTGWGVAEKYAENINRDTGKIVRVKDYAIGGLPAISILNVLRSDPEDLENDDQFKSLRSDIAEAEVIVFFANPRGDSSEGGVQGGLEDCISAVKPPDDCTLELYEPYISNLKAVYTRIFDLREGKPTIIRAVDLYNPIISIHRERNMEIECTACLETFNAAIRRAAETFNIPLISVYGAFNGFNHNEDPREKGFIGPDGIHASEKGKQVIADLLSGAGYVPVE
jgi:hypothetical protein